MSYYQFNSLEILQKAKERYSKEKIAEHYSKKKKEIKEMSKDFKNLSAKDKEHQKRKISAPDSVQKRSITK